MERIRKYADPGLLIAIVLLLIIGVFMVASSSFTSGLAEYGKGTHFLERHLIFLFIGILAAGVGYVLPLKVFQRLAFPMWLLSMVLCAALYTRLGVNVNGATRWLAIPHTHIQFMPSDILKYASIFTRRISACSIGEKEERRLSSHCNGDRALCSHRHERRLFIGHGYRHQPFGDVFISGMNLTEFVSIVSMGIAFMYVFVFRVAYRMKRLTSFIHPFDDIANTDWQLAHSLYAIGTGSVKGIGYFRSHEVFDRLPEAYNDFIFAVIGEEFGFIGTTVVIALFALFIQRGFLTALKQKTSTKSLLPRGSSSPSAFRPFSIWGSPWEFCL